MAVAIVTDSAASLPADLVAAGRITVVPMGVTIGGQPYRDGELPLADVMARLDEGVTTSGPTPGQFGEAIGSLGDEVLVLTVSATMSATFEAARLAARTIGSSVRVIDTGTAAGGEGLVVLAAAKAAAAGASLDEVEAVARDVKERVRLVATLENLDRLAESGRVPDAAAWAGRWLGLNPLFEFKGGHARPLRPARSRRSALDRIIALCGRSRPVDGQLHVAALHALAAEPAEELLDRVRKEFDLAASFVGAFSPVMVVHTGPHLVGLAWWWEV